MPLPVYNKTEFDTSMEHILQRVLDNTQESYSSEEKTVD
jgi:hypothetical protein